MYCNIGRFKKLDIFSCTENVGWKRTPRGNKLLCKIIIMHTIYIKNQLVCPPIHQSCNGGQIFVNISVVEWIILWRSSPCELSSQWSSQILARSCEVSSSNTVFLFCLGFFLGNALCIVIIWSIKRLVLYKKSFSYCVAKQPVHHNFHFSK
jgi:hypothetical protein